MEQMKAKAMRAAGLGCAITLAIIGFFLFTTPTQKTIDFLTQLGECFGQSTTVGIFVLAIFPVIVSVISYYFWKWVCR